MNPILMGSLSRFPAVEVVSFIAESSMSGLLTIEAGGGYRILVRERSDHGGCIRECRT